MGFPGFSGDFENVRRHRTFEPKNLPSSLPASFLRSGLAFFEHVLRGARCRAPQISGVVWGSWGAVCVVVWWEMNGCLSGEFGMVVHRGSVVRRGDGSCAAERGTRGLKPYDIHFPVFALTPRDSAVLDCRLLTSFRCTTRPA